MKQVEWKEKKVSLGNAIIVGAIIGIVCGVIGANWNNIFGGFAPYLGLGDNSSRIDWSPLNEVYNKLADSYNGEVDKHAVIEGAKKVLLMLLVMFTLHI